MKIFRSPCRIQTPSRPVSYTGGWVQIAQHGMVYCFIWLSQQAQEILVVRASLVHCCAVKKNVIVASQLYDVADVQFRVE